MTPITLGRLFRFWQCSVAAIGRARAALAVTPHASRQPAMASPGNRTGGRFNLPGSTVIDCMRFPDPCEARATGSIVSQRSGRTAGVVLEQYCVKRSHVRQRCRQVRGKLWMWSSGAARSVKLAGSGGLVPVRRLEPVSKEVNVAQAAQVGWKPLGQNATRTKQACAPDIAKDRRPMPLSGQWRRLPLGAVCPTRSAGRVAAPIRRRGIRRC